MIVNYVHQVFQFVLQINTYKPIHYVDIIAQVVNKSIKPVDVLKNKNDIQENTK